MLALERFIVENDDLLSLEERIGRFNIFDALGIARAEIRHSNFPAWLLDPAESHGQGDLFLKAVLMDLFRSTSTTRRPLSPVALDGVELSGVEVRREWRHIDLLVVCQKPAFVIVIENKVGSGEHSGQLQRYEAIVREAFPNLPPMLVFLTREGDEPSDDEWMAYSYADLHRVFSRVRRVASGAIGQDVSVFLDHYLRLVGSRFMDDPEIDELCRRICTNHRQAIDLIVERAGVGQAGAVQDIEEEIRKQPDRWRVVSRRIKDVTFVPESWSNQLPAIGTRPSFDAWCWIVLRFEVRSGQGRCDLTARVWPTSDSDLRSRVIERLTSDASEFGFRVFSKKILGDKWTTIRREHVFKWNEDDEPDRETLLVKVRERLQQLHSQLASVPGALQELTPQ